MRQAGKWDPAAKKYNEHTLPEGACLYSVDMEKEIQCASCAKKMTFEAGYTSRQIHTKMGMGYAVCGSCYKKEWDEERAAAK